MALINCKECGNEISKKAKECPNCGAPQGPKQYSLGKLILVLLLGVFIYSIFTRNSPVASSSSAVPSNLRQIGYFKDEPKNRIFTIEMKSPISKSAALNFAKSKPSTPGQVTAVYFYPAGATIPADGVTLADDMFKANTVLYDISGLSKWEFAYMKYLNGAEVIVDCKEFPSNELCRKK